MTTEIIRSLKQANDFADVAREFGMNIKHNMTNCLYPERHKNNDIHPSMYINSNKQTFQCMVCDASGDVITLVQLKTGMSYIRAVIYLATRVGIIENCVHGLNSPCTLIEANLSTLSSLQKGTQVI